MASKTEGDIRTLVDKFDADQRREFGWHWRLAAREAQLPPPGDWSIWLILAGRGFGKTRAGAEWVRMIAESTPSARIALVGASLGDARAVMIEGESGLLSISPPHRRPLFEPSLRRLTWPSGAQAMLYSAGEPESLRGPQHSHAWCDEIAKWDDTNGRALATWDNLLLGMRLGLHPRIMATTTPRAVPLLRRLMEDDTIAICRGSTEDNARNLPARFIQDIRRTFGQSLLARQELNGEMITDLPGALWTRALIEECRQGDDLPDMVRTVIGVDPPITATGDACGIVVCAVDADGMAHVLADFSVTKASPERWAREVARAARLWQADRVVAEANQGGDMVASVLRAADINLPLRLVRASQGKVARAEPVAALYEAGRVRHRGTFPVLEDELCGLMPGGGYNGPGRSPDRADALVWAMHELMLRTRQASPKVWLG